MEGLLFWFMGLLILLGIGLVILIAILIPAKITMYILDQLFPKHIHPKWLILLTMLGVEVVIIGIPILLGHMVLN